MIWPLRNFLCFVCTNAGFVHTLEVDSSRVKICTRCLVTHNKDMTVRKVGDAEWASIEDEKYDHSHNL